MPHEPRDRVRHGGSYFEDVDWWKKPRKTSLIGELRAMIPEMVFMVALWEHNRKMWLRSFPFHFGLYLLMATIGLLLLGSLLSIFTPALMAGSFGLYMHWLYSITGAAGVVLSILGAMGLLVRRLTDQKLKLHTVPGDIFNLLFFIATFLLLLLGYGVHHSGFPGTLALVRGLLQFDTRVEVPGILAAGWAMGALLVAYLPLTHMSHFIGKYFTYHWIRWSDEPAVRGGEMEKKLMEYLTYRPTWAATHVNAGPGRTWVDIVSTNPAQGEKK